LDHNQPSQPETGLKYRLGAFLLTSLILTSCASPTLWGTYSTPTPNAVSTPVGTDTKTPFLQPSPTVPLVIHPTGTHTHQNDFFTPTGTPQLFSTTNSPSVTSTPFENILKPTNTPTSGTPGSSTLYYTQSGDTLPVVATHFGVDVSDIGFSSPLPEKGLIDPGTPLVIPNRLSDISPSERILPDSEFVFSATAIGFDTTSFINEKDGHLSIYKEYLGSVGWKTGPELIDKVSLENSVNPRLFLALLDYKSHWVRGSPTNFAENVYPFGYQNERYKNLYLQSTWAVQELSIGYYGWRSGTLTDLTFPDGTRIRIAPDLNAGSVAIQYFFSRSLNPPEWAQAIDPRVGFPALYTEMFGDPWVRAKDIEPLFPEGLKQPALVLPFEPNREWSFSQGPHSAWEHEGPQAALDFAPSTDSSGCVTSEKWVVASAPGLVVRSGNGVVMLDLDGDNYEQTGWNLLYLHIATKDRTKLGTWLEMDGHIGFPSCEGGVSTGTHLHFARKYNGEWIMADGPLPFILSGWTVHAGSKPYEGTLTKGDRTITANPFGTAEAIIFREQDE